MHIHHVPYSLVLKAGFLFGSCLFVGVTGKFVEVSQFAMSHTSWSQISLDRHHRCRNYSYYRTFIDGKQVDSRTCRLNVVGTTEIVAEN